VSVRGYLLAGGRSTRFGADKLRAPFAGRPVAAWARDCLTAACGGPDRVHAVGPDPAALAWLGLPVVRDVDLADGPDAHRGPLAGIVAAVADAGGYLLAADMPAVTPQILTALAAAGARRPACVTALGHLQPLAAWWPGACADVLRTVVEGGERRAVEAFLAVGGLALSLADLGLDESQAWRLGSVNRPDDLPPLEARFVADHRP